MVTPVSPFGGLPVLPNPTKTLLKNVCRVPRVRVHQHGEDLDDQDVDIRKRNLTMMKFAGR